MSDKAKCTLTNDELIAKATEWVYSLAKSGGDSWTLSVPVNFNKDPDIVFMELCSRLAAKTTSPPTTEQTELWKEVLSYTAEQHSKIAIEIADQKWNAATAIVDAMYKFLVERYSITRKQEVPEAVEFKDWCEKNESALCFREQRTLSTAELYAEFQLFKKRS